jgi:dolichol kinase
VAVTLRHELARKAIHLASAIVPASYAAGLRRDVLAALLGGALVVAVGVELARRHVPRVREPFERLLGDLLRPHERARWSGATWMLISYLLALALFPAPVAVAAMLAVALGDAAAAVIGRWAGARRAARSPASAAGKTWAGTIACAVATVLGALLVARLAPGAALACAVAAALAERPSGPLDDNVRVALAAGGGAQLAALLASRLALP